MKIRHLRTKIILASFPMLLLGVLAFAAASNLLLLPGFQKIENEAAIGSAARAANELDNHLAELSQKAADWGNWDQTYSFVKDHNQKYIKDNLDNQSLSDAGVDYMLYFNASNQLVQMKHVDIDSPDLPSLPLETGIKDLLAPSSPLLSHATITDVHQGVVIIPEGIYVIVSRPILTSQATGPSRGSIVFAELLDAPGQQKLAGLTHLKLAYLAASDASVTTSVPAYPSQTSKGAQWVSLLSDTHARAFAVIPDIYGQPSVAVQVELTRTISQHGRDSMQTFLLAALLAGLLIIIATALLLNSFIVARILGLSSQLQAIKATQDTTKAVAVGGNDELTRLGTDINDLLARLHNTHDLAQSNSGLEQKVSERTKELGDQLEQAKRMNGLMVDRELRMKELKQQNSKLRARLGDDSP